MKPLAGQRVLITRPSGQNATQAALVRDAGGEPVCLPCLVIEPVPPTPGAADDPAHQRARLRFQKLDRYRHVIFVSTNAVRWGWSWVETWWPEVPVGLAWYGVGAATARALREKGVTVTAPTAGMDSEALLALPALQRVDGERVLIVRGVGGRTRLGETLARRGARVEYAEVYRRRCPAYAPEALARALHPAPDAVLVGSGETLDNLWALARDATAWAGTRWVVPGARVAEQARALGLTRVRRAANATDQSMVAALTAGAGEAAQ